MAKTNKKESNLLELMGQHANNVQVGTTDEGLALISSLAQQQFDAELKVARCEDALEDAKKALRQIAEVDLPEAMKECGVKEFTTINGLTIKLKQDVNVGITAANRPAAYAWLAEHNFGGLIKSELGLSFDRDHLEDAERMAEELKGSGYEVDFKQSIHYQTLKAFVKERMEDTESGVAFPLELFGARPYDIAIVKPRK